MPFFSWQNTTLIETSLFSSGAEAMLKAAHEKVQERGARFSM